MTDAVVATRSGHLIAKLIPSNCVGAVMSVSISQAVALTIISTTICCGTVGCAPVVAQPTAPADPDKPTVEELAQTIQEQATKIAALETELAQQIDNSRDLEIAMNDMFAVDGAYDTVFGNIPSDPKRLDAFGRVAQGILFIENHRGFPSDIYVNGTCWSAIRGKSFIYVPVGKVAIQEGRDFGVKEPTIYPISDWKPGRNGMMELSYKIYQ